MNTKNESAANTGDMYQKLPAMVTIDTVKGILEMLKPAIDASQEDMLLDAGETETVTTPGIQLLLALEQALESKNRRLRLVNVQPALTAEFELSGCSAQLERMKHTV